MCVALRFSFVSQLVAALAFSAAAGLVGIFGIAVADADSNGESIGLISAPEPKPSRSGALRLDSARSPATDSLSWGRPASARDFTRRMSGAPPTDTRIRLNPQRSTVSPSRKLPAAAVITAPSVPPADWAAGQTHFTGRNTLVSAVLVAAMRVLNQLPVDGVSAVYGGVFSPGPPWYTTGGLDVIQSRSGNMPVWTFRQANTSAQTVIAVHGGGYVNDPSIFHWLTYAAMATTTKAVVVVPMYTLVPEGGTAMHAVPRMAEFLSDYISRNGSENVSVFGDSAGGGLAMAAVQELVVQGRSTPGQMVLVSPWLDITLSEPAIESIDDPVASRVVGDLKVAGQRWSQGLTYTDPWVSPLYGSLQGLPPTTIYSGSLDIVAPDVLRLQQLAIKTDGNMKFELKAGQFHAWPLSSPLPDAVMTMRGIYRQLGIANGRFKGGKDRPRTLELS